MDKYDECVDLYNGIDDDITELLYFILGNKFEVWRSGTIDPNFYEGHMKNGEIAGLKLTICLKDYPHFPTLDQIKRSLKK